MSSPRRTLSRRGFLRSAGLLGTAALAGCSTAPSADGEGGGATGMPGALRWWDHFAPLESLQGTTFDRFAQGGGPPVEYTVYNPNEQAQALQLAFGSRQLPDVFSLAGLSVPPSLLHEQGWFAPLTTADAIRAGLPDGIVTEGMHTFDGALYSFPIFSPRQYETLVWFDRDQLARAGLDPEAPPASWDDLRAAARAVQRSGVASGIVLPLQFPDRLAAFVLELAQTAGFPGTRGNGLDGVDLTTGEIRFHDDAFVAAIEFLLSFARDDTMFLASTSLDARSARVRWAAQGGAFFLDGPYNAGVLAEKFPQVLGRIGVGPIPTPDGRAPVLTRPPNDGTFWVSAQSGAAEDASALLELFVSGDYQRGLAAAMDQPPLDLGVVAGSDAHPTYKRCIRMFGEQVFLGPAVTARNPRVAQVLAARKSVEPDLGEIVQGIASGQITDVRGRLRQLSDESAAARDAAITEVGGVSAEDWAFPGWRRGEDYAT
ncbi:ABC transporter substrate-binding protein [Pseudonocardia kunmingensis]|nr:extracellular solute-binding protein [Pseudonocardia kunmingensis]